MPPLYEPVTLPDAAGQGVPVAARETPRGAAGCVTVKDAVRTHGAVLLSRTVTLYVPADKPVRFCAAELTGVQAKV